MAVPFLVLDLYLACLGDTAGGTDPEDPGTRRELSCRAVVDLANQTEEGPAFS